MGLALMMVSIFAVGQGKEEVNQRMEQDIEVAENILATLFKQESGRRGFFPVEVKGHYVPGYGVTFRLPVGDGMNRFIMGDFGGVEGVAPAVVNVSPNGYSYSYSRTEEELRDGEDRKRIQEKDQLRNKTTRGDKRVRVSDDSLSEVAYKRFMDVAKNFLADYGDVISGLKADERIMITNRSENFDSDFEVMWFKSGRDTKRRIMSVEAKRSDVEQLKQGKVSRNDFMSRLKIVNTETADALDPDLEVLGSMFRRLYSEDLSKTYYVQGGLNYERLKDFGVMYYMKVYSSLEEDNDRFFMPTVSMRDMSQTERDDKVKEMYPRFENELKENIVEYGRTLRSLKDEELLVFNVRLTKCVKCGIPASLEVSIKGGALKDYSSGKASKEATLAKLTVKKTGVQ